jgi:small-conductance mechanosensitive channel
MAGRGGSGHGRDRRRWWLAGLLLLVACLGTAPGLAQVPQLPAAASGDPAQAPLLTDAGELTPEAATALVARLSDAQVRELLLAQLNAEAERRALGAAAPGMIDAVTGQTALIRQRFADLIGAWPAIPAAFGTAVDRFVDERTTGQLLYAVFGLAVVFGVAGLAEMMARRSFRPARDRLLGSEAESRDLLDRSVYLLGLLALDLAGVLAFALGAVVTFLLFDPVHQPTRALALGLLGAIVGYRAFMLVSRFLLNPTNKRHRMSDMGDADAAFIHGWMRWVGAICTFGFVFLQLIQHLGEPGPEHALMGQLLGLLLVFCVAYPLIHRRAAVTRSLLLLVEPSGPMRRFLAAAAPILTALAVIAIFLVYLMTGLMGAPLPPAPGLLTIIVMLIVPYVDTVLERTVVYRRRQQEAADTGSGAVTTVVIRAVRILIWLGSLLLLANAWSVDLRAAASAGVGDTVSDALVDIGFAWFLAYLGWELARIAIDRRIAAESGPAAGEPGEMGGSGATRLATLLPLAKRAIQITIAVITVMITLSALGVDIGPLLAGAGVVGIAVGFGAQTLVRDVVSGAFFLMDDAFRVGEYVDVGSVKGTVEKISVRSFRLRHHRGPLHTVPFGEIQQLTNYSRDWVIMKLEFRVPFDTDPDQVRKIFKRIGQDLLANPELGPDFIEPFKSQGVFTLDDSALVIRGKFMAKPGKQFVARREIYNAVQRAFAAAGIRFADRRVTVQVADSNTLTPEERRQAVEAGAASAIAAAGQTPGGAAAADTR